jgi:hypothetical protein
MNPIRVAALTLLAAAALLLLMDVLQNMLSNDWNGVALGYLWSIMSPRSLQGFQRFVEGGISVLLWQKLLLPLLMLPSWALLAVLGALMLVFGKRRED